MEGAHHTEITRRIKHLIEKDKVSDYFVWKKAEIPRATFSVMIRDKSPWKLDYLIKIASLFDVSFSWLVFGSDDYIQNEMVKENEKLKSENLLLKEEVGYYRIIRKSLTNNAPEQKIKIEEKPRRQRRKK